ncbi:hypothetical protein CSKR_200549 [Clonorchis sinensis]|uniref:Uncharacterized protein n=1 Tax=Clonorchis sinensis TaxID=79923 RepID=A0A8T1MF93_CLOSI|nr:hypothetical protein CSKR_200549 [Clonorchis sinensis]
MLPERDSSPSLARLHGCTPDFSVNFIPYGHGSIFSYTRRTSQLWMFNRRCCSVILIQLTGTLPDNSACLSFVPIHLSTQVLSCYHYHSRFEPGLPGNSRFTPAHSHPVAVLIRHSEMQIFLNAALVLLFSSM